MHYTLNVEMRLLDAQRSTNVTLEVFQIKVSTFNQGWLVKGSYQSIALDGLGWVGPNFKLLTKLRTIYFISSKY